MEFTTVWEAVPLRVDAECSILEAAVCGPGPPHYSNLHSSPAGSWNMGRAIMALAKPLAAVCALSTAGAFFAPRAALPFKASTSRAFSTRVPDDAILFYETQRLSPPPSPRRASVAHLMATPVVKRVAIVGAGIGGLTLANALCLEGSAVEEVKVFEKFDSVKPGIGGGVQINSGAVVLARLGLGDAVKASDTLARQKQQQQQSQQLPGFLAKTLLAMCRSHDCVRRGTPSDILASNSLQKLLCARLLLFS